MARHIGIVACSAEGASLCYRTISTEAAEDAFGTHGHPEITMHTPDFGRYMAAIGRDDWRGVGEIMLESAGKLATAGADFLICPDNTIHQALPFIAARSPLPWLHIADIVLDGALARGHRRLALMGTRWLVDSEVYPAAAAARGLDIVRPSPAERDEIARIIMEELVRGRFLPTAVDYLRSVTGRLRDEEGCEAVILGCTELPLVLDDGNAPLPTLDSTRLLARAALAEAAA